MSNKKTAVEWILDKLAPYIYYPYADSAGYDVEELIQQAKAMEKEQIKDAFDAGTYVGTYAVDKDGEEYYNETYNQQSNG